jgi:hypothetical protein
MYRGEGRRALEWSRGAGMRRAAARGLQLRPGRARDHRPAARAFAYCERPAPRHGDPGAAHPDRFARAIARRGSDGAAYRGGSPGRIPGADPAAYACYTGDSHAACVASIAVASAFTRHSSAHEWRPDTRRPTPGAPARPARAHAHAAPNQHAQADEYTQAHQHAQADEYAQAHNHAQTDPHPAPDEYAQAGNHAEPHPHARSPRPRAVPREHQQPQEKQ